jgi:hypothetical protein
MIGKNEFRYVMRRVNWKSVADVRLPAKGYSPLDGSTRRASSVAARSGDQHVSIAQVRQGRSQRNGTDTQEK